MTTSVASTIAGRPRDLRFWVEGKYPRRDGEKWCIHVSQISQYPRWLIWEILPATEFPDLEDVLWYVERMLYDVLVANSHEGAEWRRQQSLSGGLEKGTREEQRRIFREYLEEIEYSGGCLNLEMVDWIMKELAEHQKCDTSQWQ